MDKMVRCVTVQDKYVFNILRKKGRYFCTHQSDMNKRHEGAYKLLQERMQLREGDFPIFTFSHFNGETYDLINEDHLLYLKSVTKLAKPNFIVLELKKYINDVIFTDFSNWIDVLHYYGEAKGREKDKMEKQGLYKLDHALNIRDDKHIQVVCRNIQMRDLLNVWELRDDKLVKIPYKR
jgi:hypothetical protein